MSFHFSLFNVCSHSIYCDSLDDNINILNIKYQPNTQPCLYLPASAPPPLVNFHCNTPDYLGKIRNIRLSTHPE